MSPFTFKVVNKYNTFGLSLLTPGLVLTSGWGMGGCKHVNSEKILSKSVNFNFVEKVFSNFFEGFPKIDGKGEICFVIQSNIF